MYQISYRYLKPFMSYRGLKHWKSNTHTHTFGRELKITFLDVLDYSEYSDTNISNFFSRKQLAQWGSKKHMNQDSHIASSLISQSCSFEEVRCYILASSQRKLLGYIKFLKFDVTKKKLTISNSSKIWRPWPILTKFRMNHYLVLVQLDTKF